MFKWIKEILSYGSGRGYEEGSTVLPEVDNILPMPEVKPLKGENISEPIISFIETVRKYPKRFDVGVDCSCYEYPREDISDALKAYRIRDKQLDRGWFVKGGLWLTNRYFMSHNNKKGYWRNYYEDAFFLTPDEIEYLIQEISSIMNYRVDRKAKLDKIRADRRIRDKRNKLKDLYYVD